MTWDFEILLADDYQDAFNVEWEYAWHPELDPPAALRTVLKVIATAQRETE